MHYTRIAAFLLGACILGSMFMAFVATQNFDTVDEILKNPAPEAGKMILALGNDSARHLLRHVVGEENRRLFEAWELAEILIALALAATLFFGVNNRILTGVAGAIVILTLFEHVKITPELTWLGRSIDFIPWTAESLSRDQFWKLHTVYVVIEVAKLLLAVTLGGVLFTMRRGRRSRPRVEVDAVNYAHHRHVDR